jgi:adenosine deaminase
MLMLARRNGIPLPFNDPCQFKTYLGFRNFRGFAKLLLMGVHCLRQPRDFSELVLDLGYRLKEQNILHAEITWTPQFYMNRGISLNHVLAGMNQARDQIFEVSGITMRWIPDLVRSFPQPAKRVIDWLLATNSATSGIVALGLGGPEHSNPSSYFAKHFSRVEPIGLAANPHTGEGAGAAAVRDTILSLNPRRIGHGVRVIEDPEVIALVKDRGIVLEVCPTSNLKLGIYPSYRAHPLKTLLEAGCRVTINSDDPVLFSSNLVDEYRHAVVDCGLSIEQLKSAILTASKASYLEESKKQSLEREIRDQFSRLEEKYQGLAAN